MCNHELKYLKGTADGIFCTKCGAKVSHPKASAPKVEKPAEKATEKAEEKPKRTRAKKGDK